MADFQIGLFSCCSDIGFCLIFCICPCYGFAANLAQVDNRECTICDGCCMQNPQWVIRNRIRVKYGLALDPCTDCLISAFCGCCANIQHHNEMKARESLLSGH